MVTAIERRKEYQRAYQQSHLDKWRISRQRHKEKFNRRCQDCGALIMPRATFCKSCASKGERNKNWRGGKYLDKKTGYVTIRVDGKKMYEHRYIWEQTHNHKLPRGWQVDHLNGIRNDNRPENLAGKPRKDHRPRTFIRLLQKRIRELEQLHLPLEIPHS